MKFKVIRGTLLVLAGSFSLMISIFYLAKVIHYNNYFMKVEIGESYLLSHQWESEPLCRNKGRHSYYTRH